ncbi:MAG: 2,3-bisphosphoglycerate-independent phosphoglycerate mutase [Candidatus Nanosyncoccaceae bacterium]|jgi:2,3-bisphosphoglycerate-independent phosphoglycerate mutase
MDNLPLVLLILDGFGLAEPGLGNAISNAKTPVFDYLWQNMPHTQLQAAESAVGLPEGQMGNSEVGHLNIGAGRVVKQTLVEINDAIADGEFVKNAILQEALETAKENGERLHLIGLVSDGGVHSHIDHLVAIVEAAKNAGLEHVFIHAITDGRDTATNAGLDFIQTLDLELLRIGVGEIATVAGRYYTMDRDKRWERIAKGYQAMVNGAGERFDSAEEAIAVSYDKKITDEFIKPCVINPSGTISDGDTIIFFGFRPDRMIQIVTAFDRPNEVGFTINNPPKHLSLFSMTKYDDLLDTKVLFPKQILKRTLGEVLSNNGLRQTRIAETEKYPHVTYYFNGGEDFIFKNEKRTAIPSPKVATYDMQPAMSASEIANAVITDLETKQSDVLIVNFANCDMVGHTGDFTATIQAVEAVDREMGRILAAAEQRGGITLITADHGNAEIMLDDKNQPCTTHTTSPVPFILTKAGYQLKDGGKLADIAPTILELIGIKQPTEMTGESLLQ